MLGGAHAQTTNILFSSSKISFLNLGFSGKFSLLFWNKRFLRCYRSLKYGDFTGKRSRKGDHVIDESSPVIKMFRVHQELLDLRHDKHERLVKLSRDITIESKRTIFLLHRYTGPESKPSVLEQALSKIHDIQKQKFQQVAEELKGEEPYQFLRAYSSGLQEYIEALSFYHYIKSKRLVSLAEVQKDLIFIDNKTDQSDKTDSESDTSGENHSANSGHDKEVVSDGDQNVIEVHIPPTEYMLGLADLTGELMRLAINSVGLGNLDTPFEVCSFLRDMRAAFSSLQYVSREMNRKVSVLNQSLQKVETACYTLQVRGSEIPKHMLADVFSSGPSQGPMFEEDNITHDD